ncbi:ROK family protein [Wenxinia marina]|uniref:N-acetylglucosamine kinase n=1 Tax=Wenxinia marina DSM 24838 TaxID=1123501 RepID=A0A0D0QFQ2_9RHOB|nr:ROK family protein [Wenxinia marina]KIQ69853.1 Transcriptional regulator/sugar kinase [Wenxinia marina DSM 24838]GGL61703.1 N-acetyl-D-glucosamine kinase [Wenxinia marina]
MTCGGIDLGGTKIEARLFEGAGAETVEVRRIPTPLGSFEEMIGGIAEQVRWLTEVGGEGLPIGLSVPGIVDPVTGIGFASNVPTTGRAIAPAVTEATGRILPVVNDCMAFAYSEAHGGAGDAFRSVFGLVLGTGVGAGFCLEGRLPHRHAGLAVEVGHVGVSARALERHGLPLFRCGCGKLGCVENYVSGTGVANLAEWKMGRRLHAPELAASDDPAAREVMDIWADVAGDVLNAIQLMLDPDCIALGGGLSNLPGVAETLTESLSRQRLGQERVPLIVRAQHGDSSGARGAALLAVAS